MQTLRNLLVDDENELAKAKQSLIKVRNGDLSELTDQLNAFYASFNENDILSLLDPWIKEENKEQTTAQLLNMFRKLYDLVTEFYKSNQELIVDFLRKAADLLFRLIDANDTQEAILMTREFITVSEDQLYELNSKTQRLVNLILYE